MGEHEHRFSSTCSIPEKPLRRWATVRGSYTHPDQSLLLARRHKKETISAPEHPPLFYSFSSGVVYLLHDCLSSESGSFSPKPARNYVGVNIVTDSGGVFYSKRALAIYEALDIRKERIDPKQSWQNYIEAHFGIMRRLADFYLNKAPTLDEMKKAHRKFIQDYNSQIHFAHRERQDGRHSPQEVLRGMLARTLPAPTLARIFFATEFTRYLDRSGYIRFRRWRV